MITMIVTNDKYILTKKGKIKAISDANVWIVIESTYTYTKY